MGGALLRQRRRCRCAEACGQRRARSTRLVEDGKNQPEGFLGAIFYNAAELMIVLNQLAAEGHPVRVAALSPYATRHLLRFGDYVLDLTPPASAVSTHLELDAGDGSVEPPVTS